MEPRTCLCGDIIIDEFDWCDECECCFICCKDNRGWEEDDNMSPPDEGRGSIYVDPAGLR